MISTKKTVLLQKICCYGSIVINGPIMFMIFAIVEKNYNSFLYGGLVLIAVVVLGWGKISRDITLDDLSHTSVILEYVATAGLAGICTYFAYRAALWFGVSLTIAIILEGIIVVIIPYRYRIWNKIKSKGKTKK